MKLDQTLLAIMAYADTLRDGFEKMVRLADEANDKQAVTWAQQHMLTKVSPALARIEAMMPAYPTNLPLDGLLAGIVVRLMAREGRACLLTANDLQSQLAKERLAILLDGQDDVRERIDVHEYRFLANSAYTIVANPPFAFVVETQEAVAARQEEWEAQKKALT